MADAAETNKDALINLVGGVDNTAVTTPGILNENIQGYLRALEVDEILTGQATGTSNGSGYNARTTLTYSDSRRGLPPKVITFVTNDSVVSTGSFSLQSLPYFESDYDPFSETFITVRTIVPTITTAGVIIESQSLNTFTEFYTAIVLKEKNNDSSQ